MSAKNKKSHPTEMVSLEPGGHEPSSNDTLHMRAVTFSGPIPPPEILERYEAVMPGLADRVISMAEKQQQHRMKLDISGLRNESMGTIFAFLIAITAISF